MSFQQSVYMLVEREKEVEVCVIASCPCPSRIRVGMLLSSMPDIALSEKSLSVAFDIGEEESCTPVKIGDLTPEEQEGFEVVIMEHEDYDAGDPRSTTIIIDEEDSKLHSLPVLHLSSYHAYT